MRIIEVSQPTFLVNMRFGRIGLENDNESDIKVIHSETYPLGFPQPVKPAILFRYTNNRGFILTEEVMRDFQDTPKEPKTTKEIIKSDDFRRNIERVIMEANDVSYGPDGAEGYYDHLSAFDGVIRVIENSLLSTTENEQKIDNHTNKIETLKYYANNFVVKNILASSDSIVRIDLTNGGVLLPTTDLGPNLVTLDIDSELKVGDVISFKQDLSQNNIMKNLNKLVINGQSQKASILVDNQEDLGYLSYIKH